MVENPPDIFQFSIHGASKQTFEAISCGADFERCLENARRFLASSGRSKTHVRVLCALQARNLREYRGMFHLLSELELLDDFRLEPVYDYDPQLSGERRVVPTEEEAQAARQQIETDIQAARDFAERDFCIRWLQAMKEIKANNGTGLESGPCLLPWFSSYITARGEVLPCCYLTGEQAVMGNIFEQSFSAIWNGEAYRQFRKNLREDRQNLPGCSYCPRNDTARLRRYGAYMIPGSKWKKPSSQIRLEKEEV
jgi:radical SAM protein with 4Fe4S-binding SPASM domain